MGEGTKELEGEAPPAPARANRAPGWIAAAPPGPEPQVAEKWPVRRTILFSLGVCAAAWIVILVGVFYLL